MWRSPGRMSSPRGPEPTVIRSTSRCVRLATRVEHLSMVGGEASQELPMRVNSAPSGFPPTDLVRAPHLRTALRAALRAALRGAFRGQHGGGGHTGRERL